MVFDTILHVILYFINRDITLILHWINGSLSGSKLAAFFAPFCTGNYDCGGTYGLFAREEFLNTGMAL